MVPKRFERRMNVGAVAGVHDLRAMNAVSGRAASSIHASKASRPWSASRAATATGRIRCRNRSKYSRNSSRPTVRPPPARLTLMSGTASGWILRMTAMENISVPTSSDKTSLSLPSRYHRRM